MVFYFDTIVVGGGHAGVEAAYISARNGIKTLLITDNLETVGKMSCNPAVGGIGKSQLIYEVDALGGLIGKVSNLSGIHFRLLNCSKGSAVKSIRIQVDPILYRNFILLFLCNQDNLFFLESSVDTIMYSSFIKGIILSNGKKIFSKTVILSVGTFLNGLLVVGNSSFLGGRLGDKTFSNLFKNLRNIFTDVCRFKTGTPPRVRKNSIDYTALIAQKSDFPLYFSSLFVNYPILTQDLCFSVLTNNSMHEIVQKNLFKSALYRGTFTSFGPRYCLSIEDKILRFNKDFHQIFLESDGLNLNDIYLNGLSTSAPLSVQYKMLKTLKGFQRVKIVSPGYMVEYDCFDPKNLSMSLETNIKGLFFTGQINGTTGYEEAAAQGIVAGLNSVNTVLERKHWIPDYKNFFLGVLIKDLTSIGVIEPYRMFTSRSNNRINLRYDNVFFRFYNDSYFTKFYILLDYFKKFIVFRVFFYFYFKQNIKKFSYFYSKYLIKSYYSFNFITLIKRYVSYKLLQKIFWFNYIGFSNIFFNIFNYCHYVGYLKESKDNLFFLEMKKNLSNYILYINDYNLIFGLSSEVIEKLNYSKPYTLKQVARIFGVTPVSIYLIFLKCIKKL